LLPQERSHFLGLKKSFDPSSFSHATPGLFTRWQHPRGKTVNKNSYYLRRNAMTKGICSNVLAPKVCKVNCYQCHREDHLKLLPEHKSFMVAILLFYESILG